MKAGLLFLCVYDFSFVIVDKCSMQLTKTEIFCTGLLHMFVLYTAVCICYYNLHYVTLTFIGSIVEEHYRCFLFAIWEAD